LCKHIRENYTSYNIEYKIGDSYLRNDHVWSIAIHKLGAISIPTNLWYSINKDSVKMNDRAVVIENTIKIAEQDVHVMNKQSLMEYVKKELGV
jgi:hypothetical protein